MQGLTELHPCRRKTKQLSFEDPEYTIPLPTALCTRSEFPVLPAPDFFLSPKLLEGQVKRGGETEFYTCNVVEIALDVENPTRAQNKIK